LGVLLDRRTRSHRGGHPCGSEGGGGAAGLEDPGEPGPDPGDGLSVVRQTVASVTEMQHGPPVRDNRPAAFTCGSRSVLPGRQPRPWGSAGRDGPRPEGRGPCTWRRGWDLNPRTGYPVTSLAGKPDRPDSGTSPCCAADRTQPSTDRPPTMPSGAVAERTNAPVLKTGDPQGSEGSNPSRSANQPPFEPRPFDRCDPIVLDGGTGLRSRRNPATPDRRWSGRRWRRSWHPRGTRRCRRRGTRSRPPRRRRARRARTSRRRRPGGPPARRAG
jgi:hypothetical protein